MPGLLCDLKYSLLRSQMKTIPKLDIKREGEGGGGKDTGKLRGQECPIVTRSYVMYLYILSTFIQYTLKI